MRPKKVSVSNWYKSIALNRGRCIEMPNTGKVINFFCLNFNKLNEGKTSGNAISDSLPRVKMAAAIHAVFQRI